MLGPWYPETRSRFGSESYADRLNAGQAATLFGHRRFLSDQFDAKPARPSFRTPRPCIQLGELPLNYYFYPLNRDRQNRLFSLG
jgi:hypothetical protein